MTVFLIGTVRVHTDRNVISRGDREERLEPKTMGVLQALACSSSGILTRSELQDIVWGETAGSDEALSRAVSLCRRAFRAVGAKDPIETVSRSGYSLRSPAVSIQPRSERRYQPKPEAHLPFLQGRTLASAVRSPDDLALAVQRLDEATTIDPDFAEAWMALAQARAAAAGHTPFSDRLSLIRQAGAAAEQALKLDRSAHAARTVLMQMHMAERNICLAMETAKAAYDAASDDADAAMWLGYIHAILGHLQTAIPLLEQAVARDPLQGRRHMIAAVANASVGAFEKAEFHAEAAIRQGFIGGHEPLIASAYLRGDSRLAKDRFEAALIDFQKVYNREPKFASLIKLAGKGMYSAEPSHRRMLKAAAIPIAAMRKSNPDGLLPYIFLRTGSPHYFTTSFGDRLLPGNTIVLAYVWDSSETSLIVRESSEFAEFAKCTGIESAWNRFGRPDTR